MKETLRRKLTASKRRLVLEEVSHLFETEGFHTLKMQDVAAKLEMSVGALYKLFASKEELYHAYVAFQIERFYDALRETCRHETDAIVCLARYVRMKFDVFAQKRKAVEESVGNDALFFLKLHHRHHDPAEPIYRWLAERFEAIGTHTPLAEGNHLKTAYMFNAYTTGYIEYWLRYGEGIDTQETEVVRRFLEGIKAS